MTNATTPTHTPGPWGLTAQYSPLVFSHANGISPYIAQVFFYSEGETGSLRPEAYANAALIAAAPDLLAEAQALVERLRGMAVHPSHYAEMERVITRATNT